MSMRAFYDLKDMLCQEVDEIAEKKEMSAGDLEAVHKLTDTIKNIDKIILLESDDGYHDRYSRDGDWEARMRGNYDRGSSYRRHRDSMGRYSRDGEHTRGYSRAEAKDDALSVLKDRISESKDERERDIIRRAISLLEDL